MDKCVQALTLSWRIQRAPVIVDSDNPFFGRVGLHKRSKDTDFAGGAVIHLSAIDHGEHGIGGNNRLKISFENLFGFSAWGQS